MNFSGKRIIMILGVILLILILLVIAFKMEYKNAIYSTLTPIIQYENTTIHSTVSNRYCGLLDIPNKHLYWGKLPEQSLRISINIPFKGLIYVYPYTDDAVIVRYEPRYGIKRNYVFSGINFNDHLETLYADLDNELFNKTVDLPKAR
ncbi:MAG: hypothetical protein IJ333_02435 [Clostridia bacterium]|nr:hypothetical protein [Clostridia bacterium]